MAGIIPIITLNHLKITDAAHDGVRRYLTHALKLTFHKLLNQHKLIIINRRLFTEKCRHVGISKPK
ncbi:hypothetical protein [Moraxella sp.]|uniref:hypothetical protein n=1 Tax=Moraxella sp. TaxID=479 RepID=UPI002625FCE8|nr:hypothetical protein [Moraxella sp.]